MIGTQVQDQGQVEWAGPVAVNKDSFVRPTDLSRIEQPECQFWVTPWLDGRFTMEAFDGRCVKMRLWRLVRRLPLGWVRRAADAGASTVALISLKLSRSA